MIFYLTTCYILGCLIFSGADCFQTHPIVGVFVFILETIGAICRIWGFDINWETKDHRHARIPI